MSGLYIESASSPGSSIPAVTPQLMQTLTDVPVTAGINTTIQTITFTPTAVPHLFTAYVLVNSPNSGEQYVLNVYEDGVIIPRNLSSVVATTAIASRILLAFAFWYQPTNASHVYTLEIVNISVATNYTVQISQLAIL
jgi:hypothetical protein